MKNVMITAHSGCEGTPDNSVASIETGIALGADCVEVDVRMDAAGKLWLTHDTASDYGALIPLEAAFERVAASRAAVNCDLKEYAALRPVLALADRCGVGPAQLALSGSVDPALLGRDPEIARRARIFLNCEELVFAMAPDLPRTPKAIVDFIEQNLPRIADGFHAAGAEALNAPFRLLTPERIAVLRAREVPLSLWTVNEAPHLRRLLKENPRNITTRSVRLALRLRAEAD